MAEAEHLVTQTWPPRRLDRTWRTLSGYVALPQWAEQHTEQACLQWSRTREERVHGLIRSGSAETLERVHPWPKLGQALAAMADHLAPAQTQDVPIWELEGSGQIRRGAFRLEGRQPTETTDVELDAQPERLSGGEAVGLRARRLTEVTLPEEVLVNPVASYLGPPVTNAVGWTTAAPVAGSTPNWNKSEVRTLSWSGHDTSYAKSMTSALVEGIERCVGALQSRGITTMAAGKDLPGQIVTPEDFPAYPEDFYQHRGSHYDANEPHEWVRARSLSTDEPVWFPREYVFYGEQMRHRRWALSTSSGCATGSSTAEAALFGLLELLERDAFVASWHGKIPAQRIEPDSLPGLSPVLRRARLLGYAIETGLMPSPTGVPAAVAVASAPEIRAMGTACHPDPARAIMQAVEEAWTYLPERVQTARNQASRIAEITADPHHVTDIDDHPLVFIPGQDSSYDQICGPGPGVSLEEATADLADFSSFASAKELLDHLVDLLKHEGVETYAYVQTSQIERSLGFETVMVLTPALLPIDFGWGNQRALSAPRLAELSRRFTGQAQEPRLLPHPFS